MINIFKKQLFKLLSNLNYGTIQMHDGQNNYLFQGNQSPERKVMIKINDNHVFLQLFFMGTNGISSSYFNKGWECDDLYGLFDIILKNKLIFNKMDNGFAKLAWFKDMLISCFSRTTFKSAKQNILRHYDLSNEFFRQFLDNRMMYSCAIFENPEQSLDEASEIKLKRICDKLELTESDHLLEIGSGWGGLALYAHEKYGCRVTTTTISDEQFRYVNALIKSKGLSHKISILNKDYRHLEGIYNKIVSVEMIEAVGFKLFPDYFNRINLLLKHNGLFLLQCITINDQDYERAKFEIDFIKKYIFPGGCLPSVSAINSIVNEQTQFELISFDDIGQHYVKTLSEWQKKFNHNIRNIFSLGFSESFARMWEYYFSYCQAGFQNKHISDIQAVWKRKA